MVQIHGIRRASADAKYRQMTGQPVKPLILKLCLPAVISNLVTTAYNLTDTFFIGQLGTAQSGAIGIAFSIMTVMQALGFFFGNGAGNSMSRELGKQNNERAPDYWRGLRGRGALWFGDCRNRIADPAAAGRHAGIDLDDRPIRRAIPDAVVGRRTLCMRVVRAQRTAAIPRQSTFA